MDLITLALAKKYVQASLSGAGALKGESGESAYDIAVRYGYKGTEEEWLTSLIGQPGQTPYIGENLHWFINGVDTGVAAQVSSYEQLTDKPTINGIELSGEIAAENSQVVASSEDIDALFN